jgi:hypothetical protein
VCLEWKESGRRWTTEGVSQDFIEAAWLALVHGFRMLLEQPRETQTALPPEPVDAPWAV